MHVAAKSYSERPADFDVRSTGGTKHVTILNSNLLCSFPRTNAYLVDRSSCSILHLDLLPFLLHSLKRRPVMMMWISASHQTSWLTAGALLNIRVLLKSFVRPCIKQPSNEVNKFRRSATTTVTTVPHYSTALAGTSNRVVFHASHRPDRSEALPLDKWDK